MRALRTLTLVATTLAAGLTVHSAWNSRQLRRAPRPTSNEATEHDRVAVLLPARDEAHRIAPCLTALLGQDHPGLRVFVLDDDSTDDTGALVRGLVGADPRVEVIDGVDPHPSPGWLGKPWACQRLADAALADPPPLATALPDAALAAADPGPDAALGDPSTTDPGRSPDAIPPAEYVPPDLLVFLDADVVLAPDAVRRVAALMADSGLDLASPCPRQLAGTPAERLVQPLLQWSWLTTLPLTLAERSPRPSLTAANGQLLAIRPAAYRRIGGHGAVRHQVLEDIGLARAVKVAGGRAAVTDGTDLATCRMYAGTTELVGGYAKSLWAAFGSPLGSLGSTGVLTFAYVLPPAVALLPTDRRARAIGTAGYLAGVTGRILVARRTGGRPVDAWAHPLSIVALDALTALSWWRRRRGTLAWKGRAVHVGPPR